MDTIDQNTAYLSLERNLLPGRSLIDDRSERDRLHFLSQFSSLVNFYDENNNPEGDWRPFLLKDPVFLLATISQTRFNNWNLRYLQACFKVEEKEPLAMTTEDLGQSFDQLFDLFTEVFVCIENWTSYMQKSAEQYDLRTYVLRKVEDTFSAIFWALRSFKEALSKSGLIKGVRPVQQFYFTALFSDKLWTENKDKIPYWELLKLRHPINDNTAGDFFHALKTTGDELFTFFHTIIQHAVPEYEKLKTQQSKYPDTTLLRTFVSLLKVQQDQLNGIPEKYLEFYYRDILQQHKAMAEPDKVMICAETAKKDAAFHLPAGTEFDAGLDPDKNPVTYASREEVTLNPAAITAAYTLSCLPGRNPLSQLSSLYFQAIPDPGEVKREEDGVIKQWQTFGGAAPPLAPLVGLGIAFASPMLLLREGQRNITLTLTFSKTIDRSLFREASYYFSTQTAWLQVKQEFDTFNVVGGEVVTMEFKLDETLPAIEKFAEDPDGLSSQWPMFKIEFTSFTDMASPPVLMKFDISVEVSGVKNLQLYSDEGLLTTKTPFQLLGPMPLVNSSFIIGSNEIFSKPFNDLTIELHWDTLPGNFAEYYKQYNEYIEGRLEPPVIIDPPSPPPSKFHRFINIIGKLLLVYWIWQLLKKKKKEEPAEEVVVEEGAQLFSNTAFRVNFQLLSNQAWKAFRMLKKSKGEGKFVPYKSNDGCNPDEKPEDNLLFSMDGPCCEEKKCLLTDKSYFGYESILGEKADPSIQETPLEFTDTSTSGFMRMTLEKPLYGFGSEMYANVISEIALQNAAILMLMDKEEQAKNKSKKIDVVIPVFKTPAALPFVPRLITFTGNYKAACSYDLRLSRED